MKRKSDHIVDTSMFVSGQITAVDDSRVGKQIHKVLHLLLMAAVAEIEGRHDAAQATVSRALSATKRIEAALEPDRKRVVLIEAALADLVRRISGCRSGTCG